MTPGVDYKGLITPYVDSLWEPSQNGASLDLPHPHNLKSLRVSITFPSASTKSAVPVNRIEPLFGFRKIFGLSLTTD